MLTIEMMVEVHGRKVEVERKEDRWCSCEEQIIPSTSVGTSLADLLWQIRLHLLGDNGSKNQIVGSELDGCNKDPSINLITLAHTGIHMLFCC